MKHPTDPQLEFETIYHPPFRGRGENGFSLGEPSEPERYEITRIFWRGTDITDFVYDYADNLLPEWEGKLCGR